MAPESVRGKRVLLKPNLVEPTRDCPHMTTHPAMILAAAEVFRGWGASVTVGEGPGHVRDTEMALVESGVAEALDSTQLPFADLNYEEVAWTAQSRPGAASSTGFYFPQAVAEADLIVSLPKMKTHHWVGVTAAMKNLYGTIPGIKYGWPKNVLHHNGIPETVFDINASLPKTIAIVDGIDCMEGDGPIMGTLKPMGLVVVGTNPAAVDATVCRLMDVDPLRTCPTCDWPPTASARSTSGSSSSAAKPGSRWPARSPSSTSRTCKQTGAAPGRAGVVGQASRSADAKPASAAHRSFARSQSAAGRLGGRDRAGNVSGSTWLVSTPDHRTTLPRLASEQSFSRSA